MSQPKADAEPNSAELVLLEAWVADNPGSHAAIKLARAYFRQDRLAEAREILGRSLAINPGDVDARELLADVLERMGDSDGAMAQLAVAAQELGRHAGVYGRLAKLLRSSGRPQEAARVRALAEAMEAGIGPLSVSGGLESATMAAIYASQGHTSQAEGIYRKLLARNPNDPDVSARLADVKRAPAHKGLRQTAGASLAIRRLENLRAAALGRAAH